VGLSFDPRFTFKKEGNTLRIQRNEVLPEGFWGAGIHSLTAIVGSNGSGKSSALCFLMEALIDGAGRRQVDAIMVYEQKGTLYIYQPAGIPPLGIETDLPWTKSVIRKLPTFHYMGHFAPYDRMDNLPNSELAGSYNASDGWLLVRDFQDYANVDTMHLTESIYNHLSAYNAQNNYRICELLMQPELNGMLTDFRWPKYVIVAPNISGLRAIQHDVFGQMKALNIPAEKNIQGTLRDQTVNHFIYHNLLNLIAENKGDKQELVDMLTGWQNVADRSDAFRTFESYVKGLNLSEITTQLMHSLLYVLDKLFSICDFDELTGIFYIQTDKGTEQLRALNTEIFRSQFFLTARFFDVYYSHQLNDTTYLSSGELEMLNLLSRIYYGIVLRPQKFTNLDTPTLLLLDEAEIGFHPAWQRQYVNILTQFIQTLTVKPGVHFQLVITSHSPIILSDIPACCTNYLTVKDGMTITGDAEQETFAENVFNLYRRSFFMKDGLVGAFATGKIDALYRRIKAGEANPEVMKEVKLIGDERIRGFLLDEIGRHQPDMAIDYYQRKIDELRGQGQG